MPGSPSLAQLLLCCLAASVHAAAVRCVDVPHDLSPGNESDAEQVVMVVGQSAAFSGLHARTGLDMRAGMEAALALANETSPIKFALASLDDAYDAARQKLNVEQLLCEGAGGMGPAFAIAGTVGSAASEAALVAMAASVRAGEAPVPFVGALSGSLLLRTQSAALQNTSSASGGRRAGVVLARPGLRDELSAMVSLLSSEWEMLSSTAVFYEDTPFAHDAVNFLNISLKSLNTTLLSSYVHSIVSAPGDLRSAAAEAVRQLYARRAPRALVLLAGPGLSGALLTEIVSQHKPAVVVMSVSIVTAAELHAAAPQSVWDTLWETSPIYFTQAVPIPAQRDSKYRIVTEFQSAMRKYRPGTNLTHVALEGFIAGRLVATAASRALELYGWPLTRANFLDTVFRDIRTFKLCSSWTLGPYGDGVGSDGATQTEDDWCNQGAHQVFATVMNTSDGSLLDAFKQWSYKFSGCSVAGWNTTSPRAVVGYDQYYDTTEDSLIQIGLSAAISDHNSASERLMAMTATLGQEVAGGIKDLKSRDAVAVIGFNESEMATALELIRKGEFLPLIAPRSGLLSLRSPFNRGIVNLFASYYQEARTAASFLIQKEMAHLITVAWNTATHGKLLGNLTTQNVRLAYMPYSDIDQAVSDAASAAAAGSSFIIVASPDDAWQLVQAIGTSSPVVLSSVIDAYDMLDTLRSISSNSSWAHLYRASLTMPLSMLPSNSPLRQEFESWVSSDNQMQQQFEGFFLGKFLSAVIGSMSESAPKKVTADSLLDAIYATKYFKIDNKVTVGPFNDQSSGERLCNQGMDTVYLTKLSMGSFTYVPFAINEKIKRSELEIGERIGKGQFGTVHNGDWHGTPVAIKVIEKTSISREDLDIIKGEMALTQNLHHPNLLMTLGVHGIWVAA
eukprot:m51a1_g6317 hypothetical protein (903) ;mRNA; r:341508-344739